MLQPARSRTTRLLLGGLRGERHRSPRVGVGIDAAGPEPSERSESRRSARTGPPGYRERKLTSCAPFARPAITRAPKNARYAITPSQRPPSTVPVAAGASARSARERSIANCFTSRTWLVASLFRSAVIFGMSRELEERLEVVVREAHVAQHQRLVRREELHDLVDLAAPARRAPTGRASASASPGRALDRLLREADGALARGSSFSSAAKKPWSAMYGAAALRVHRRVRELLDLARPSRPRSRVSLIAFAR